VDFLGNNDQDKGCITEVVETANNKRKSIGMGGRTDAAGTPQNRRPKHPAYFIPELAHVVALCDERIPFVTLAQEVRSEFINLFLIKYAFLLNFEPVSSYQKY